MVSILLGNGFEEMEALVPADLLRRAGLQVSLTSLAEPTVIGSHQIAVTADSTLDNIDPSVVELVLLPGGLGGVHALAQDPRVEKFVRIVLAQNGYVAAICAAPTLLASWGILDEKCAVCYPGMEKEMGKSIVQSSLPFVVDGHIITGEAAGATFPFGLKLVELLCGATAMQKVKDDIHYHG